MALMIIGIDTSHNKKFSCIVSGFKNHVDSLYAEVTKILTRYGRKGVIHWKVISDKVRRRAKNDIYSTINKTNVHFTIFEHQKPENVNRKEYYLVYVPNQISQFLENWLKRKFGTVEIVVDKDYEITGVKSGSEIFVRYLLRQLTTRLAGEPVTIRTDKRYRATLKEIEGGVLDFIAFVSSRNESKAIQLADLILGYYIYDKEGIKNKVYFRKI